MTVQLSASDIYKGLSFSTPGPVPAASDTSNSEIPKFTGVSAEYLHDLEHDGELRDITPITSVIHMPSFTMSRYKMEHPIDRATGMEIYVPLHDYCPMGFGQTICFGRGGFDDWCAYTFVGEGDNILGAMPVDAYYFDIVSKLGKIHGRHIIYEDMLSLFKSTGPQVDKSVVEWIKAMSAKYGVNAPWAENAAKHIYYGMIAEENKANARLKKHVKLFGIHRILRESADVTVAAKESFYKKWRLIRDHCIDRGIWYGETDDSPVSNTANMPSGPVFWLN